MNILITKKESSLTIPETINFKELINNSLTLSPDAKSEMIDFINSELNEQQQQIYVRNLYMCMNFNPTTDFPVDLDHVYKNMGFANKGNAMKTIKSNFTKDEDYKISLVPKEKSSWGGSGSDKVMLNIDTYKTLCMLVKTQQGKEIRKYYVKLENIYNGIIKKEIENTQNLLVQNKLLLIQKDIDNTKNLEQRDKDHILELKLSRHKMLIEKFRNKKCVYLAELEENKIKVGSTKDIHDRYSGLKSNFGICIFLDIFDHKDYQTVESNILINVKDNLYKKPINGYTSIEVVELSNIFNYKQLHEIVKYYINTTNFLLPLEIIEKQKIENEKQKLDIIQNLLNNGESLKNINLLFKNIIYKSKDHNVIEDNKNDENHENNVIENDNKDKDKENEDKQINVSKQILNLPVVLHGRKPKGQKIHKIDSNNLNNIIKTYDSMAYLLRAPESNGYNKSGILKAISDARIYKGYRWNFINKETLDTIEYKNATPIRDPILKLNETKDIILKTFTTKDETAKELSIGKLTMRNIIRNQEKYNSHYYIEYKDCPLYIIEKYDKPIFGINSVHAKKIKQSNPITNTEIVFNNLNEIHVKLGISSKTIIKSINDKTLYAGSLWEYV